MKHGRPQCKDIPDAMLLQLVVDVSRTRNRWAPTMHLPRWVFLTELQEHLGAAGVRGIPDGPEAPYNLVRAKCARLIQRTLLDGCACGCRGDFELTETGRQYLEDGERL